MDVFDRASQEEERILENQIRVALKKVTTVIHKGTCHYCGEVVTGKKLFCDSDCATDHHREQSQLRKLGR